MENQDLESKNTQDTKIMSIAWPVGLSVFILAFSFYLYNEIYNKTLSPNLLNSESL